MKTTFSQIIFGIFVLAFAVGCGKDGGGSKGGGQTFNPIINPNMPTTGQTALTNLKNWYAQAETANMGFRGTYAKKTSKIGGFNFEGSLCIGSWGINCEESKPTHCFRKNPTSDSYDVGTTVGTNLYDCTITQTNMTKAMNAELTAAVNGDGYQLLDVRQQGSVYNLVYGVDMYNIKSVYTIDTNYHSVLNPVRVQSLNGYSGTQTYITKLQFFQF